ncbi:type I DNA topoisomerase [Mycoplasmopsis hyopharyngis]|uniref:type I DNA topoisomerase n=1 Tax=Mycoplasmopsis hyopharyngis TaxID=29558 RepID=UPI003873BFC0
MNQKLVIVESPNKIETLKKYLGTDYDVMASVGHIKKLSTRGAHGLGIDLDKWEPYFIIDPEKKDVVKKIKEKAKSVSEIYIATDPDREGEAIGAHLIEILQSPKKNNKHFYRVRFNEITKDAVLNAIQKPSEIDENLVEAQKARRMLDRIIGFRLSQLMKKKLTNYPTNPSAGRVQSIALKLVVDRENEIEAFVPVDFHKLSAKLQDDFLVDYINLNNSSEQRYWIFPEELQKIKDEIAKEPSNKMLVVDIKESQKTLETLTPFKQAVLYKKSPYNSRSTQAAAQHLYEIGLISYPRTDSTRLSQTFVNQARSYIEKQWGKEYILENIKGEAGTQDAHEAIRPTNVELTPLSAKEIHNLNEYDFGVYKLIYEHTLSCLIKPPVRCNKTYLFKKHSLDFKAVISSIIFNGYYVVKNEYKNDIDPKFELNQEVDVLSYDFQNCQTKPPARYSEGSLIEKLDQIKVGRPSTFSSTIRIILEREYVVTENNYLKPTNFGKTVLEKLLFGFPSIINEQYTASVENQLDDIAIGNLNSRLILDDFYSKFNEVLDKASQTIEMTKISDIELDEQCPNCGSTLIVKHSKFGKFAGCSGFPNCKYSRNIQDKKRRFFFRRK